MAVRDRGSAQMTGERLLEREEQLTALDRCLGAARAGRGRLVLVAGEAGSGKTTLVHHFCQSDAAAGSVVLWGACEGLRTPRPLSPLIDIARSTGGALQAAIDGGEKPAGCFDALRRELERRWRPVLVIEDLHWADEATLDVLTMLGRRIGQVPALTIATLRDEGLAASATWREAIGELQTGAAVSRLNLAPLSADAVDKLVGDARVELDPGELYGLTAGNPFFVTEVLASGGHRLPASARDAVLARAMRLSADSQAVLEAIAVVPGPADVWLLEALLGERQVLAALIKHGAEVDTARLAHHAEAADDGKATFEFARAAAGEAASAAAHREAAEQYRRALRHAGGLGPVERGAMLELFAEECFVTAAWSEEQAALEEAIECHRRVGDKLGEGRTLRRLGHSIHCRVSDPKLVRATMQRAIDVLEQLPPSLELAKAYLGLSSTYLTNEDVEPVLVWAQHARAVAAGLDDPEFETEALYVCGNIEFLVVRPEGRSHLERALAIALEHGLAKFAGDAYLGLAECATRVRDRTGIDGVVAEGLEYCEAHDLGSHAVRTRVRRLPRVEGRLRARRGAVARGSRCRAGGGHRCHTGQGRGEAVDGGGAVVLAPARRNRRRPRTGCGDWPVCADAGRSVARCRS